jgi:NSS family neurotransmitter:Na+ symporter
MITYGSYMKKDVSIESSAHQIELFDTGIAFLAGLMIIPAVFAFSGGDPSALNAGPGLMFITLPKVFANMWGGQIMGAVFFLLVLLAALTSSISLMETVVSVLCDKLKWNRKLTCLIVFVGSVALGLLSIFGYGMWAEFKLIGMQMLDFFDFITNSVLMPLTALFTAIVIGYFLKPKSVIEEVEVSGKFRFKGLFVVMIKYVAPIFLLIILASSVLSAFGIITI